MIDHGVRNRLFDYMGGICKGLECNPIQIGGVADHVHLLCILSRKIAQMDLLEEVKKRSSKWIKTIDGSYSNFYWQDGYGIFSVNPLDIDTVSAYITNQEKHHGQQSFQDEYRGFLQEYEMEWDERYVWD
jgi:REP element-mobilizing transposase RayT